MFVDRKKHRSGHVSIIVMDMSSGKLREVKNFGVAKSDSEADELYIEAKQRIRRYGGQLEMGYHIVFWVKQDGRTAWAWVFKGW